MPVWLKRLAAVLVFWSYVWLLCTWAVPLFHPVAQNGGQQHSAQYEPNKTDPPGEPSGEAFWVRLATDPVAFFTAWVAGFTLVLGGSTLLLWWETRRGGQTTDRLARAAELSAKAAIGVELPILRAEPPELHETEGTIGAFGSRPLTMSPTEFCFVPSIVFENFGRTNAFIEAIRIGWDVCAKLPIVPEYRHAEKEIGLPILVPLNSDRTLIPRHTITLSREQIDRIDGREAFLWFFVEYAYSDFLREPHTARFCWRWDCPDGVGNHYLAATGDPPEAYTRHT